MSDRTTKPRAPYPPPDGVDVELPRDGVDIEFPTRKVELPKDITFGTRTGRWPSASNGGGHAQTHTVYPQKYMVVTGGLSLGHQFYGPFENAAKANDWAVANLKDGALYRIYAINGVPS